MRMYHEQDCCEAVWLEDVCGDLEDLIGSPIVRAECRQQELPAEHFATLDPCIRKYCDSGTWTFYELATNKGSVTLRWCGASNGCYNEAVDIEWR